MNDEKAPEYTWAGSSPAHNHEYLAPAILHALGDANDRQLLDIGAGNGALTGILDSRGFRCTGTEISESGLAVARTSWPAIEFVKCGVDDELPTALHAAFDVVVAAEVVEHLLLPRRLFHQASQALKSNGTLVVSTPFHGYMKNVALAISGRLEAHWDPLWDYGHVKFFSMQSLTQLADECGYETLAIERIGRVPALAKTMVGSFRRRST